MSDPTPEGTVGLSGRLSVISLAEVFQWIHGDRFTGALVIRRSRAEKQVFFENGETIGCLSDDPAEFYGRCLIANGVLPKKKVVEALHWARKQECRLGVALRELELLDEEEIQRTLGEHIEERVCDLFLWDRGAFYVIEQDPPHEELLARPLDTTALVLEGSRWADEYRRIRRVFLHDDIAIDRGPEWSTEDLDPLERQIAEAVDGKKTLEQLYRKIQGSHFRFLESALDLTVRQVLDVHEIDEKEPGDSSREIGIYDLLLDQAADEEILRLQRQRGAFAAELVESMYPVWLRQPPKEHRQLMRPEDLELCERLDGNVAIRDVLSESRERAEKEIELIGLELHGGNLALLPRPLDELSAELGRRAPNWWRRLLGPLAPDRG